MTKIMIADPSEVFIDAMRPLLSENYELLTCTDGLDAETLLPVFQPDLLIINLFLPIVDGLSILRHLSDPRPAILVLAPPMPHYVVRLAMTLGASYFISTPCRPEDIREHAESLLEYVKYHQPLTGEEAIIDTHLRRLGFNPALDGTKYLLIGIPLFAKDLNQRMIKELYPAIAQISGSHSVDQVEHAIRDAIRQAWNNRDESIWRSYFPKGCEDKCPTSKLFISRLALELTKTTKGNRATLLAK